MGRPAAAPDDNAGGRGSAEAETIFKTRCSTCHGMEGKGNGAAALTLNPKPRSYNRIRPGRSRRHGTITSGRSGRQRGAAVGKSPLMPPNPDLADKPNVVNALMRKVRSFAAASGDGGK